MSSGYFITFEGFDGAGKTTQILRLKNFLENEKRKSVLSTREPGGTLISELIRDYVLENAEKTNYERDLLLFAAARLLHVEKIILPALKQGKMVLCDRFSDSSWIYQVKEGRIDQDFAKKLEKIACQNLKPDITFILDLPVEISVQRIEQRLENDNLKKTRFENEDIEKLKQRRSFFKERAAEDLKRYYLLDGQLDIDVISSKIQNIICEKLNAKI